LTPTDGSGVRRAWFNAGTGQWGTVNAAIIAMPPVALNDNWYRISAVSSIESGATSPTAELAITTGNGVDSYTGSLTNGGIYVWEAQWKKMLQRPPVKYQQPRFQ
jgi:hypothetical protein